MRLVVALLLSAAVLSTCPPVHAQEVKKRFGAWEVSIDTDRFEGKNKVIAVTIQKADILAVRCFPSGISVAVGELALGPGRFEEGMEFDIKFRADKNDIIETSGVALNDKIVQLEDSQQMARQMRTAKEVAFRLSYKGVTVDKVFKMGAAPKALGEVFKACTEST